jgi:hypothetical protein
MKLCTTGVLAFAASLTLPAQTNTYKISGPFTHDNLTVFLIHGPNKTDQRFLTLEEALDQRKVIVYETRDVNELAIENVSDEDVFIESGDIVKGGAQDRTLKDDLILPAKSGKLSISSFCVEHGRWTARARVRSDLRFGESGAGHQATQAGREAAGQSAGSLERRGRRAGQPGQRDEPQRALGSVAHQLTDDHGSSGRAKVDRWLYPGFGRRPESPG